MISTSGATAVYRSMSPPTADDRQGARPPAVSRATRRTGMATAPDVWLSAAGGFHPSAVWMEPSPGSGPGATRPDLSQDVGHGRARPLPLGPRPLRRDGVPPLWALGAQAARR